MKKILQIKRMLAAIIIFLMISSSAHSQKLASTINTGTKAAIGAELNDNSVSAIILNENTGAWIKNKGYVENSHFQITFSELYAINEKVVENEKSIEGWMMNEKSWEVLPGLLDENYIIDEMEFEEWMFDEFFWKITSGKDLYPTEKRIENIDFWVMVI